MRRKPKSLKKKIIFRLFLVTFFVFALTELFLLDRSRQALDQSLDKSLRARLEGLTSITDTEGDGKIYFEFSDELMPDYSGSDPRAYFILRRLVDNSEIERSHSLEGLDIVLPESLSAIPPHKPIFWDGSLNGKRIRFVSLRELARLETDGEDDDEAQMLIREIRGSVDNGDLLPPLLNEYVIVIGVDTIDTNRNFAGIVRRTSIALGVGLIILLLLGGIVLSSSLKPLSVLEEEVKSISATNFVPVTVPGVREIAGIARTLNGALRRLKASFDQEKRFTADVAHELRTPISEIRSLAEVALKWDDKMDEFNRDNYKDFLAAAEQMQKTVVTLLSLARCDAGAMPMQKKRFELGPLVDAIWEQYREKASAGNITCRGTISPGIVIFTDKILIRAILENLFSNAVDYTPRGGMIEWEAGLQEDNIFFTISNNIIGLAAEDLSHLFERFWRKDDVRTSNGIHSGLGLSTARSFAAAIGIEVIARMYSPDRLSITLSGKLG